MLPPQLRANTPRASGSRPIIWVPGASLPSHPRSSVILARSFWWRRCLDWTAQTDLGYQRSNRIRTLKTRAKLLEKLRRHSKFNWDFNQRPFFTPKHIRSASHWGDSDSGGRRRWQSDDASKDESQNGDEAGRDGYELSQREKAWDEQVERMRRRIASDPYEAIFGKRFEPFWSPLVPSWMREEMGLQPWPRPKGNVKPADPAPKAREQTTATAAQADPKESLRYAAKDVDPVTSNELPGGKQKTETLTKSNEKVEEPEPRQPEKKDPVAAVETKMNLSGSYSYASSTSWDSFTNKTRRVEWDSVSNKTKEFEYDPISNRMVLVEPVEVIDREKPSPAGENRAATSSTTSHTVVVSADDSPATNIQVKQSADVRRSVPIPSPQLQPYQSMTLDLETRNALNATQIAPPSSSPPRPAALSRMPASDLDLLTADHVRASMGKTKNTMKSTKKLDPQERVELENEYDQRATARDIETDAILRRKDKPKPNTPIRTEWDQAEMSYILERELEALRKKKEKLLKDERGLFHVDKQKREVLKLDNRIDELVAQVNSLTTLRFGKNPPKTIPDQPCSPAPAREADESGILSPDVPAASASTRKTLQPALERVQAMSASRTFELDDSAAHESTEPVQVPALPKEWSKQAEMLQADRVQRTSSKHPYPMKRWVDDMTARKAEYEAAKAKERSEIEERDPDRNSKLERASDMLQAEVNNQKLRMQEHETRYSHKLRSLRGEVDLAYKQSAVHAENHLERIQNLEQELSKAQKSATESKETAERQIQAYKQKVQSLRGELDVAYKQSAMHSQKHLEHIRDLEHNLARARKEIAASEAAVDHNSNAYKDKLRALRGELEIAYKRSSEHAEKHVERIQQLEQQLQRAISPGEAHTKDADVSLTTAVTQSEQSGNIAKSGQLGRTAKDNTKSSTKIAGSTDHKLADQELVSAIKAIYETKYGTINVDHRQPPETVIDRINSSITPNSKQGPQVVEVESDVDLGEALASYEKESELQDRPQRNTLENEMALSEREAHEAQALMQPENSSKMKTVISDSLEPPVAASATPPSTVEASESTKAEITWEEPPVYKVLAYDSGNDILSTATTTANFTGSETPISIQQALSQLYQPARFVSHFAELQRDGYQVIHGAKDLLVFKKVRSTPTEAHSTTKPTEPASKADDMQTNTTKESLTVPGGNRRMRRELAPSSGINPIDGMRATPATGNFASPTGFVNHDPVVPLEPEARAPSAHQDAEDYKIDPLRIRRQEPHFTATSTTSGTAAGAGAAAGSSPASSSSSSSSSSRYWNAAHRRHARIEERSERRRQRKYRRRSSLGWVVKTSLAVAAVMYLVGAAEEKSRDRGDRDEWTRKTA